VDQPAVIFKNRNQAVILGGDTISTAFFAGLSLTTNIRIKHSPAPNELTTAENRREKISEKNYRN